MTKVAKSVGPRQPCEALPDTQSARLERVQSARARQHKLLSAFLSPDYPPDPGSWVMDYDFLANETFE